MTAHDRIQIAISELFTEQADALEEAAKKVADAEKKVADAEETLREAQAEIRALQRKQRDSLVQPTRILAYIDSWKGKNGNKGYGTHPRDLLDAVRDMLHNWVMDNTSSSVDQGDVEATPSGGAE